MIYSNLFTHQQRFYIGVDEDSDGKSEEPDENKGTQSQGMVVKSSCLW